MNTKFKTFSTNIEQDTLRNNYFRHVISTQSNMQLVLMSLNPNEEIGMEVHEDNDQFFRVEKGSGKAIVNGEEYMLTDGSVIIIPAGSEHNIINTSDSEELKVYTIYAPAHHPEGTIHETKEDAMKAEQAESNLD